MVDRLILSDTMNGFFIRVLGPTRIEARTEDGTLFAEAASFEQMEATIRRKLTRKDHTVWPYILYLHGI